MKQSLDLGMMMTRGFRSPPDTTLNCWNPPDVVPNTSPQIPILHTNKVTTDKVNVYNYLNPDQIMQG
jgi:hypothetical protein